MVSYKVTMKFLILSFFCKPISSWQRAVALGGSWCEHHNWCSDPCIAVVLSTKTKIDAPLNTHPFRKFLTCVLAYVKFLYLLSPSFPNSFIHSDLLSGLVLITHESLLSLQSREKDSARQKPLAVRSTQKVIVQLEWFMGPGWLGLFPPPPHSLHTFVPMSPLGTLPWSSPCCITTISLFFIFFLFLMLKWMMVTASYKQVLGKKRRCELQQPGRCMGNNVSLVPVSLSGIRSLPGSGNPAPSRGCGAGTRTQHAVPTGGLQRLACPLASQWRGIQDGAVSCAWV